MSVDLAPGDLATGQVMISYRRSETRLHAKWLHGEMRAKLPGVEVFMDVDAIEPGADFRKVIESALSSCDVVIAVIGPFWSVAQDAQGRRRIDDPGDFVRLEIAAALERGITVVPLLVNDAQMPREDQLPDALRPLVARQAFSIPSHLEEQGMSQFLASLWRILPGR